MLRPLLHIYLSIYTSTALHLPLGGCAPDILPTNRVIRHPLQQEIQRGRERLLRDEAFLGIWTSRYTGGEDTCTEYYGWNASGGLHRRLD